MFLEGLAPQGLKGSATTIQGIHFGEVRMPAAQIAPLNFVRRYPGIGFILFYIIAFFNVLVFQSNNLYQPANKI